MFETRSICRTKRAEIYTGDLLGVRMVGPKYYQVKMAGLVSIRLRNRVNILRNRLFRDRTNPFDLFDDDTIYRKFRFYRHVIFELTEDVTDAIEFPVQRTGALPPILQ